MKFKLNDRVIWKDDINQDFSFPYTGEETARHDILKGTIIELSIANFDAIFEIGYPVALDKLKPNKYNQFSKHHVVHKAGTKVQKKIKPRPNLFGITIQWAHVFIVPVIQFQIYGI